MEMSKDELNLHLRQERESATILEAIDSIKEKIAEIRDDIREIKGGYVTTAQLETVIAKMNNVRDRVIELEKQRNWAVMTVLGLVIAAVVGAVLVV